MVLTVLSPPIIEPNDRYGWKIMFWLGDAFDYSIPFREALSEIVGVLQQSQPVTLDLPPHAPDEDFVEGVLTFGTAMVNVYYEYSLGYLSLMSDDRGVLEDVAARVFPCVRTR
jgi:hypothetical protein